MYDKVQNFPLHFSKGILNWCRWNICTLSPAGVELLRLFRPPTWSILKIASNSFLHEHVTSLLHNPNLGSPRFLFRVFFSLDRLSSWLMSLVYAPHRPGKVPLPRAPQGASETWSSQKSQKVGSPLSVVRCSRTVSLESSNLLPLIFLYRNYCGIFT